MGTVIQSKWGSLISAVLCMAGFLFLAVLPVQAAGSSVVYTASSNSASGDGTKENPYSRFEDAVAGVAEGGTIYIMSSDFGFINDQGNDAPFVIDKNVTVKPEPGAERAVLESRAAGIVLGADVSFHNIELNFANTYHDQICANGYRLVLDNVSRNSGSRLIDIAAGGLYDTAGRQLGVVSGKHGQVIVSGTKSQFGNFYAGSINGGFDGDASICIEDASGAALGEIYASGAKEAEFDRDNWFALEEPPAPVPDPAAYPVTGRAEITVRKAPIRKIEGAGAAGGTAVIFSTMYRTSNLSLTNIMKLTIEEGVLEPAAFSAPEGKSADIVLYSGGTLDLNGLGDIEVHDFTGGGKLVLDIAAVISIAGEVTGKTAFETAGGLKDQSGLVTADHVYIRTQPETQGTFTFVPYPTQEGFKLVRQSDGSWVTVEGNRFTIIYWTEDTAMGDVSINWETFDLDTELPAGAVAEANSGYHFVSWTDENGNEVSREAAFIPQKTDGSYTATEYIANFQANTYTAVFDANGGSGAVMEAQSFVFGEQQKLYKNVFTREGYSFRGWNTERDGLGTAYADSQEVMNLATGQDEQIALYAQWTKNQEGTSDKGQEGESDKEQEGTPDKGQEGESDKEQEGTPDKGSEGTPGKDNDITEAPDNPGDKEEPAAVLKVAGLKAYKTTYHSVCLKWTAQGQAAGYRVYRSTSKNKGYQKLADVTASTYTDKKLVTGKRYYYKVTAYSESTEGAYSNVLSVKPGLAKPVINVKKGKGYALIKYKKVSGATGYEIYRSTKKKTGYKKIAVTKKTSYKNKKLKSGKTYYYKVRAYRKVKGKKVYSAYSKVKSVRLK